MNSSIVLNVLRREIQRAKNLVEGKSHIKVNMKGKSFFKGLLVERRSTVKVFVKEKSSFKYFLVEEKSSVKSLVEEKLTC